jgi:hypothetical protein
MRHFLQYWKGINFPEGETLDHSASSQLNRVTRDDALWIMTIKGVVSEVLGGCWRPRHARSQMRMGRIISSACPPPRLGGEFHSFLTNPVR